MYRGFELSLTNEEQFADFFDEGEALIKNQKAVQTKAINSYQNGDAIDAARLQADWFGEVKANVFISHSHKDISLVTGMAGYLSSIGLHPFVDSFVWGHSQSLLKKIDNWYCLNKDKTFYKYDLRNLSTSYVHLMLSSALTRMIDCCECVLFLNTAFSVKTNELIKQNTQFTASPWIYSEIETTRTIAKRPPPRREGIANESYSKTLYGAADSFPEFNFELDTSHLTKLSQEQWSSAVYKRERGEKFLDLLYRHTD